MHILYVKTIMEKLILKTSIRTVLIFKRTVSIFISLISTFSTSKSWKTNNYIYLVQEGDRGGIKIGNWNFSILETSTSKHEPRSCTASLIVCNNNRNPCRVLYRRYQNWQSGKRSPVIRSGTDYPAFSLNNCVTIAW